jgi:hypothetical protein
MTEDLSWSIQFNVDRETAAGLDRIAKQRNIYSLAELIRQIITDAMGRNAVPPRSTSVKRPVALTVLMSGEMRGWLATCDRTRALHDVMFDVLREAVSQ